MDLGEEDEDDEKVCRHALYVTIYFSKHILGCKYYVITFLEFY